MKFTLSYSDDPGYYKSLIAKINLEANFPMYLKSMGYTLNKKSVGSMEFRKDNDRIVLQTNRVPMTYFNRNDSKDKGQFFKFLRFRENNFYKTVQNGLDIIGQVYDPMPLEVQKTKRASKSIESNYHIVPLQNADYLTQQRGISKTTLESPAFKGRIFNAFHKTANGGKIANIAIPKYDLDGQIKNYILYNKPYRSRADKQIKKFRLVLNKRDHFLFYSKPVTDKTVRVVFGESVIDLLSYHEIHGKAENFYVSFGGNVYQEKLDFFLSLVQRIADKQKVELVSITDNDLSGFGFDLKVLAALINARNPKVHLEMRWQKEKVALLIHYDKKDSSVISTDYQTLNYQLDTNTLKNNDGDKLVRCTQFLDKLMLEFNLSELNESTTGHQSSKAFKALIKVINETYLSMPFQISKSKAKDWNEDLIKSKQNLRQVDTTKFKFLNSI